jgi:hypothetical protein
MSSKLATPSWFSTCQNTEPKGQFDDIFASKL